MQLTRKDDAEKEEGAHDLLASRQDVQGERGRPIPGRGGGRKGCGGEGAAKGLRCVWRLGTRIHACVSANGPHAGEASAACRAGGGGGILDFSRAGNDKGQVVLALGGERPRAESTVDKELLVQRMSAWFIIRWGRVCPWITWAPGRQAIVDGGVSEERMLGMKHVNAQGRWGDEE
jgi:hypothetical protein